MIKKLLKWIGLIPECRHQFVWVRDQSKESLNDKNSIIRVKKCIFCGKIISQELVIFRPNHEYTRYEIL